MGPLYCSLHNSRVDITVPGHPRTFSKLFYIGVGGGGEAGTEVAPQIREKIFSGKHDRVILGQLI